jgi:acetone carboxylase, gamma subunit
MARHQITEYLDIELDEERWICRVCDHDIGAARDTYKKGLLIRDRDPREIHASGLDEPRLHPDPEWCRVVEMFCPSCATLVEVEYLPPGHPLTHDIELDLDNLKTRAAEEAA